MDIRGLNMKHLVLALITINLAIAEPIWNSSDQFLDVLLNTNSSSFKWRNFVQNLMNEWSVTPVCADLLKSAVEIAQNQTWEALGCSETGCLTEATASSWPIWMLDSWGRPLPGIYSRGPFFFLGHFDQCASLSTENRTARYCKTEWDIELGQQSIPLHYGFCILKECEHVFHNINVTDQLNMKNPRFICKDAKQTFRWTKDKIIYASIVGVMALLVIIGTLYERWTNGMHISCLGDADRAGAKGSHEPEYGEINEDRNSMNVTFYESEAGSSNVPSVALTYKPVKAVFKQNGFSAILRSFSVFRNVNRLLRTPRLEIDALHGVRVLSGFWVILGHAHLLPLAFVDNIRQLVDKLQKELVYSAMIVNSGLAVDSFFLVSATIFSFVIHRKLRRITEITVGGHCKRAMVMYLHRWIRLVPSYAFVLGFVLTFYNSMGSGPVWNEEKGVFGSQCRADDWVHHLFFLINIYPNKCMPWMWYLSVDFQLFLISPLLIACLYHSKTIGAWLIGLLVASVSVYRAFVIWWFDFPVNIAVQLVQQGSSDAEMEEAGRMFRWLYANPYARSAPYFLAILLGWNIHSKVTKPAALWLLRLLSVTLMSWALFGVDLFECRLYDVLYNATYRTAWAVGLAILIWLSYHNQFYWISDLLNARQWVPVSRLGYGIYLTHELLIIYFVFSRRTAWNVTSLWDVVQLSLSVFTLSIVLAFVLAILVELPPLTTERKLLMTARDGDEDGEDEYNMVEMKPIQTEAEKIEQYYEPPKQSNRISSTEHWVLNGTMNETAEFLSFEEDNDMEDISYRRQSGHSPSSSYV
ncbi:unnamed protein product [Bursaphelenchus okinawaensis]|uniref:Nose resistant-to-fluoxetine protein N-terminal domain-containing protein n=1 Tax=Bursaphelenchus okinawaensis TaxID=465554 RepID=A0A811L999_9BILA|nr:unnamed protein product [Bursaphelenchus okinawaensis]CAG9121414.1 unnamed protein product [Bursaphelenchus okinawaensis]